MKAYAIIYKNKYLEFISEASGLKVKEDRHYAIYPTKKDALNKITGFEGFTNKQMNEIKVIKVEVNNI